MKRLFVKKPVVVEAYQLTKEFVASLVFDAVKYPDGLRLSSASYTPQTRTIQNWHGKVVTIHGFETMVTLEDWIITEHDGEHHYPCKPDVFEATYTEIDSITPLPA